MQPISDGVQVLPMADIYLPSFLLSWAFSLPSLRLQSLLYLDTISLCSDVDGTRPRRRAIIDADNERTQINANDLAFDLLFSTC